MYCTNGIFLHYIKMLLQRSSYYLLLILYKATFGIDFSQRVPALLESKCWYVIQAGLLLESFNCFPCCSFTICMHACMQIFFLAFVHSINTLYYCLYAYHYGNSALPLSVKLMNQWGKTSSFTIHLLVHLQKCVEW